MTEQTPATAEIEKWLRFRVRFFTNFWLWVRKKNPESCRSRLRYSGSGPTSGAHSGLQDRMLLNYTRVENAHKERKKAFDFLLCIEVQQTFSFPFHCWDIIKCLNASILATAVFERVQQFYHGTEIGNVANAVRARDEWTVKFFSPSPVLIG